MISPETLDAIASGARRDAVAVAARCGLQLAELPYWMVTALRNRHFDRQPTRAERVEVPVISVGNLTVGGTGKTPFVAWLARWFRQHQVRVSLISRGYGAANQGRNDEARELEERLPDVPHLQNPNRVAAARIAIEELETQLILLDDAFQHRKIARDLDIVLIDATNPFGYGHLLPRGLLRESLRGLKRADVIAVTRANLVENGAVQAIRNQVTQYAPHAIWLEVEQRVAGLRSASGDHLAWDNLHPGPILAFCGIGNPSAFRTTIAGGGRSLLDFRIFPDHHPFDTDTMQDLVAWSQRNAGAAAVLCTHKDLVKVAVDRLGPLPLFAVALELEIRVGEANLIERLQELRAGIPHE